MTTLPVCIYSHLPATKVCINSQCYQNPFICSNCQQNKCENTHVHKKVLNTITNIKFNEITQNIQKKKKYFDKLTSLKKETLDIFEKIKSKILLEFEINQQQFGKIEVIENWIGILQNGQFDKLSGKEISHLQKWWSKNPMKQQINFDDLNEKMQILGDFLMKIAILKQQIFCQKDEKYYLKQISTLQKNKEKLINQNLYYSKILQCYNKLLEFKNQNNDVLYQRALINSKLNKYQEALTDFTLLISKDYQNGKPYNDRGLVYYKLNKYKEAFDDFNKYISLNPTGNGIVYFNRGVIYNKFKKLNEAIEDYTKSIQINPYFPDAYYNRGNAYFCANLLIEAQGNYNKAIALNPKFTQAYVQRGNLYVELDRQDLAQKDYNFVTNINPKYVNAFLKLGLLYQKNSRHEDAYNIYSCGIRNNLQSESLYVARALICETRNSFNEAINDLTKVIELKPKCKQALKHRVRVYKKMKRLDKAEEDLSKIKVLQQNDDNAS